MKLTKEFTRLHDDSLALLSLSRGLTPDEKEFVFTHYHPGATNNIGVGGVFFTPPPIAQELVVMTTDAPTMIDFCAGIGCLAWHYLEFHSFGTHAKARKITCIEANPEFVEVGRKLVPEAEWIQGDAFTYDLPAKGFHSGISNPPYGRVKTVPAELPNGYKAPAHLMAAVRLADITVHGATMIVPTPDIDQCFCGGENSSAYRNFTKECGYNLTSCSIDVSGYRDLWRGATPNVMIADLSRD